MGIDLASLQLDMGDVISPREQDRRDASLLRALLDAARIRGQVTLVDRYHAGGMCLVGGERQTSEGATLRDACALAMGRLGLDPEPSCGGQGSTEEGGL
jgi:hypothetical protein